MDDFLGDLVEGHQYAVFVGIFGDEGTFFIVDACGQRWLVVSQDSQIRQRAGKYEIEREHGHGGSEAQKHNGFQED